MTDSKQPPLWSKLSRPFDPHWTTQHGGMCLVLADVIAELEGQENRERKRKPSAQDNYLNCIKAIVLDLFRAKSTWPEYAVGLPSGRTFISDARQSRYVPNFLSADGFLQALQGLECAGLITTNRQFRPPRAGRFSETRRYRLSEALFQRLHAAGGTIVDLDRNPSAEGIVLKDTDKQRCEYASIPFTDEASARLARINAVLSAHWYDLELSDAELAEKGVVLGREELNAKPDDREYRAIDLSARTLKRVFNNSSWDQGGRFYGGWWQNMPKALRPYILIDRKRTIEIDYSGIHPAMLLAEAGCDIPDDPYGRCLEGRIDEGLRNCVKRTFNALLNASSVKDLQQISEFSEALTGKTWLEFKRFIVASYPEFSEKFGTGEGLRLQRKDSDLAEEIMLLCAERDYPCLPIHDSFIVHRGHDTEVIAAMQEIFSSKFNAKGKVKFPLEQPSYPNSDQNSIPMNAATLLGPGYQQRQQAWWARGMRKTEIKA